MPSPPAHTITLRVTPHDIGSRVDRWLRAQDRSLPYALIQKWFRWGHIRVGDRILEPHYRLQEGDVLSIPCTHNQPSPSIKETDVKTSVRRQDLEAFESWIVYEDDRIAVINKPHGLAVQGGTRTRRHLDALLQRRAYEKGTDRWLLVHRLDKDTSGLVVLAKSQEAARQLALGFQKGWIRKIYWALSVGVPRVSEGTIRLPLTKEGSSYETMVVHEKGRHAVSRYRVLDRSGSWAWLELEPLTGRTHQLRVHCASMGTPLLGDGKYGGAQAHPLGRTTLHLHARQIDLSPVFKHPCVITAPLSSMMQKTWDQLGFDVPRSEGGRS